MLEECDVYVYDLATSTKEDLEYVCGIFSSAKTTLEE
jgi:adenylate kinase